VRTWGLQVVGTLQEALCLLWRVSGSGLLGDSDSIQQGDGDVEYECSQSGFKSSTKTRSNRINAYK